MMQLPFCTMCCILLLYLLVPVWSNMPIHVMDSTLLRQCLCHIRQAADESLWDLYKGCLLSLFKLYSIEIVIV